MEICVRIKNTALQKHNLIIISLSIVLYFGGYSLQNDIWWIHETFSEVVLVFAALSVFGRRISDRLLKKLKEYRTEILLGYLSITFLMAMCLVLVYIVVRMYATKVFALNFFAIYLLYTIFDIYSLIANLRKISEETQKDN